MVLNKVAQDVNRLLVHADLGGDALGCNPLDVGEEWIMIFPFPPLGFFVIRTVFVICTRIRWKVKGKWKYTLKRPAFYLF